MSVDPRGQRPSATFPPHVLAEIHRAADQGLYEIRGFGTKRKLPTFDDLLFLGASVSRYPLEGYREKCATDVWLGTRFAKKPIHLKIPITIAGMSFGALGANAKEAIGRACTEIGTSSTTGDGGMTEEERQSSKTHGNWRGATAAAKIRRVRSSAASLKRRNNARSQAASPATLSTSSTQSNRLRSKPVSASGGKAPDPSGK